MKQKATNLASAKAPKDSTVVRSRWLLCGRFPEVAAINARTID